MRVVVYDIDFKTAHEIFLLMIDKGYENIVMKPMAHVGNISIVLDATTRKDCPWMVYAIGNRK